jgi:bacterioferritin (cytochrome b1)
MKATAGTVDILQGAVAIEAHLMAQYGLDRRELKNARIKKLASKVKHWKQAAYSWFDRLANQIIEFGGDPSYEVDKLAPFSTVEALLSNALDLENAAYDYYSVNAPKLRDAGDNATGHNFDHFTKWHRDHIAQIEQEVALLKRLGEVAYVESRL